MFYLFIYVGWVRYGLWPPSFEWSTPLWFKGWEVYLVSGVNWKFVVHLNKIACFAILIILMQTARFSVWTMATRGKVHACYVCMYLSLYSCKILHAKNITIKIWAWWGTCLFDKEKHITITKAICRNNLPSHLDSLSNMFHLDGL